MKDSIQDKYYLEKEGNSFFQRNISDKIPELRKSKQTILDNIKESEIQFSNVLEYGCNYGDLLHHLKKNENIENCIGVEASSDAIKFGTEQYSDLISLYQGTIADNIINENKKYQQFFDLIIIDDVFGWISRETIIQSLANIDNVLKDNGFIFIRDFYPDKLVKNINHHVKDEKIYNYKVPNSHASIFLSTGVYSVHWQKIFFDNIGMSTDYKCDNIFNYRWTDIILKKSLGGLFNESKQI